MEQNFGLISIIMAAYNAENTIEKAVMSVIAQTYTQFELIIINDCSKDKTKEICEKNQFHFINLSVNLGIGGAVQTGYMYALENHYDVAVQVDGDGQHDAAFLNEMAMFMEENQADMVIGSRFIEKKGFQSSGLRRMGIKFFTGLIKVLTGKTITDPTSGLRMVDREIIKIFAENYPKDYPEPETVVSVIRKNMKVKEIPVVMKERQGGVSSISPRKSVYYMIKVSLAIIIECLR